MNMEFSFFGQPLAHLLVFASRQVVHDNVNLHIAVFSIQMFEELQKVF